MLSLSFALILIPYALVVGFFAVMALIHVQHLIHYGATTKISFVATFAFLAGATLVLFTTWYLLRGTDWSQQAVIGLPKFGGGELDDIIIK
jgi:hypothetical protein